MASPKLTGFIPQQTSLPAQVADFLRDIILSGKLRPGERVVERELANSLGVAQGTVREALKLLEHEGLIFKKANTASFVTQFSRERIREIVAIRVLLEPEAFALAHRRMTPAHLDELRGLIDRMEEGAAKSDYYYVLRNDFALHEKVWSLTGNETLERILSNLCTPMFAFLMVVLSTNRRPLMEHVRPHRTLVDALAGPDQEKVVQAVREHTNNSWRQEFQFLPPDETEARQTG